MFNQGKFLNTLQKALENIHDENLFHDERGYQGALAQELRLHHVNALFSGNPAIQEAYQKTLAHHGIRIRPGIIIHIPFERGETEGRYQGNFVAIELKRHAGEKEAREAYSNLEKLKNSLGYPLTIFINIDSNQTHFAICPNDIIDQTICFAVRLENGKPIVLSSAHRDGNRIL